jgi:hypothetical protein
MFGFKKKPKVKKQIDVGKVTIKFTFPNGDTFDSTMYGYANRWSFSFANTIIINLSLETLLQFVDDTKNPKVKIRSLVGPIKAEVIKEESYIEEYEER